MQIIQNGVSICTVGSTLFEANKIQALAAYHNDYRRRFIDEAAQLGDFGEESFPFTHDLQLNHFRPYGSSWRSRSR